MGLSLPLVTLIWARIQLHQLSKRSVWVRGVSSGSRPIRAASSSAELWRAWETLPGAQRGRTATFHTGMPGGRPAAGLACSMWLFQPLSAMTPLLAAPAGKASSQAGPTPLPEGLAPTSACPNHLHPAGLQLVPRPMPWLPRPARRSVSASCPRKGHLLPSASPWWGQGEHGGCQWWVMVVGERGGGWLLPWWASFGAGRHLNNLASAIG